MAGVVYMVIFLLGAVAAFIIMRLLFLFLKPSSPKIDEHFLKRIANALQ